jgi:hypothetical protein
MLALVSAVLARPDVLGAMYVAVGIILLFQKHH